VINGKVQSETEPVTVTPRGRGPGATCLVDSRLRGNDYFCR